LQAKLTVNYETVSIRDDGQFLYPTLNSIKDDDDDDDASDTDAPKC